MGSIFYQGGILQSRNRYRKKNTQILYFFHFLNRKNFLFFVLFIIVGIFFRICYQYLHPIYVSWNVYIRFFLFLAESGALGEEKEKTVL